MSLDLVQFLHLLELGRVKEGDPLGHDLDEGVEALVVLQQVLAAAEVVD